MTCEEVDELLAAYSVAALSSEETEQVRAHLATCRRHDEALASLQAVAERLPLAAAEREPPPELRSRLLEAFDVGAARPRAGLRWAARPRAGLAYLAAAAVLVLAVGGLATWNVILQSNGGGEATVSAELVSESGRGRIVYLENSNIAVLDLDLPEPPAGRTYQAWGIYENGPVSLGLVPSQGVVAVSAELSDASAVAISEEPEGGSLQPTTEPLAVAELE